ncbi:MAG: hypothetical protein LBT40_04665 [Deltaproteobacteria bacterium]|nr:hypothetical protein [Deltaproteobacteria bacterium]
MAPKGGGNVDPPLVLVQVAGAWRRSRSPASGGAPVASSRCGMSADTRRRGNRQAAFGEGAAPEVIQHICCNSLLLSSRDV